MICAALNAVSWGSYSLRCAETGPAAPVALVLMVAVVGVIVAWMVLFARTGPRYAGGGLAMIAALFLGIAAQRPEAVPRDRDQDGGRIAVVLDLSESVRRDGASVWQTARQTLADRIATAAQGLDGPWTGRVFGFGGTGSTLSAEVPLPRLSQTVLSVSAGQPADQSNLAAGLSTALDWIASGTGAGAIYLLSDGWASGLDPMIEARRAAGLGVPIHVLGIGARQAAQGLLSWNIGPVQFTGQDSVARLNVLGGGSLQWALDGQQAASLTIPDAPDARPVRLPLRFDARGISHVTVLFGDEGAAGQRATMYTLVRGPARVLVFGAAPWVDALSPQRYTVQRASPAEAVEAAGFDAVVIDGLSPADFAPGAADRLLGAAAGGTGLMFVNGPRRDPETEPQRIADWEQSPIGPILPVNSDPETYFAEPPPRNVLIIIDTSGSMANSDFGPRAVAVARHILTFLRPQDSLTILPFSTDVLPRFVRNGLTQSDLLDADRYLGRLRFGGGTNMQAAIRAAAQLRGASCDLFVIGDGGYESNQVQVSPICRTTAIGVAGVLLPGFDTRWGESLRLRANESAPNITFQTFAPEPRALFWRDGPLNLLVDDAFAGLRFDAPVQGLALTYPRPNARIAALASQAPRNLALAFRRDPQQRTLNTAVFLGEMPRSLPSQTAESLLDRLIAWSDPDRFDIELTGEGEEISVRVSIANNAPPPQTLSGSVLFADGRSTGLNLRPSGVAGEFLGSLRAPLSREPQRGLLTLEESVDTVQSIPILFPQRGEVGGAAGTPGQERESWGVRESMLRSISVATGGYNLTQAVPEFGSNRQERPSAPLWPWFGALALLAFAGSLWAGGSRR